MCVAGAACNSVLRSALIGGALIARPLHGGRGPRLHERPLLMRRIADVDDVEPEGSDVRFLSHPRQGAGVRPTSNLFGFWVPLIFPCT